jgi:hypothetical protein
VIVRLKVAGLTLSVHADRDLPGLRPAPRLTPFLASRGGDIALVVREEEPPTPTGERLFDSGGLWSLHRHGKERLYLFREPLPGRRPYKAVLIDEVLRRGTLFLPPRPQSGKTGYALAFPLDELLFHHRLAREGGLFVHACAVRLRSGAALLCGVSGAGKTTLARLFHRASTSVLSDDRVALRPTARGFRAWGTPWHGSGRFAAPESALLRAVFFLEQSERSEAVPLRAGAAARLFSLTFPPLFEAEGVARSLAACGRVVEGVPTYELRFRPDPSARAAVIAALRTATRRAPSTPVLPLTASAACG